MPAVRTMGIAWLVSIPALVVSSAMQGLSLPFPSMLLTMLRQAVLPVLLALLLSLTGSLRMIWLSFIIAEALCLPLAWSLWQHNWKSVRGAISSQTP